MCCCPPGFNCGGGGGSLNFAGAWHNANPGVISTRFFPLYGVYITGTLDAGTILLAPTNGVLSNGTFRIVFTAGALGDTLTITLVVEGVPTLLTITATKTLVGAETFNIQNDILSQAVLRGQGLIWSITGTSPGGSARITDVKASCVFAPS